MDNEKFEAVEVGFEKKKNSRYVHYIAFVAY